MTIQDAATRAGFAKSTLVKAENGKHDLRWDHLTSLADVLGMHPADLMREPYATEAAVRIPRKPGQVAPRADACRERAGASS
jgi:transcriptional regulator with XRE-family HTH domain